jgi:hypothetical protein
MKSIKALATILVPFTLVACNPFDKHVKCNDETAVNLITEVLKGDLDKTLEKNLKELIQNGSIKDLDPAKLKLSAKNVQFNLVDSRTEFVDPNSPKTTCAIDLTASLPSDLVKKADEASIKVNGKTALAKANELNLDFNNNKVELVLNYIIQPTDKGDKVLATVTNKAELQTFLSETLTYAFLKPQIEKNEIRSIQASKKAAAQEAEVALDAAESEYYNNEQDGYGYGEDY